MRYKKLIITLAAVQISQSLAHAEDLHRFSKSVIDVIEKMPGGDPIAEADGSFFLSGDQADQVLAYSKVNQEIKFHESHLLSTNGFCPAATQPQSSSAKTYSIAPHVGILFVSSTSSVLTSSTAAPAMAPISSTSTPAIVYSKLFQDPANWKNILSANKDLLTSDQKIELISKLGTFFSNGYNYARAENSNATGFVSTEQLLTAVIKGTPGGICRDIALAQTQMLETLGFKDSYVIAYKTYHGSHATVVSVDPTTGKIIKFNYGEMTTKPKGSGVEALAQDTTLPDSGLAYKLYNSAGKPVAKLPSELGQMLSETTGGIDREFNAKNYSLAKIGFEKNGIHGNLFSGTTTSGDKISGVAVYLQNETKNSSTHIGVSASTVNAERAVTSSTADNLYLNIGTEARTNFLTIGTAQTRAVVGGEGAIVRTDLSMRERSTGQVLTGKGEIDVSVSGFLGLQSEVKLKNGKTVIENQTYINMYPDFSNVASADKKVVATNSVVVDTKLTQQLSNEDKLVSLRTAVIFRNYGSSIALEAAYEDKISKSKYTAGVRAPLSEQPSFLPGANQSAYIQAEKEVGKGITFGIALDDSSTVGPSAKLSVEGKFD
jgi:hypothetical protein